MCMQGRVHGTQEGASTEAVVCTTAPSSSHTATTTGCSQAADVAHVLLAHVQPLLMGQLALANKGCSTKTHAKCRQMGGMDVESAPWGDGQE